MKEIKKETIVYQALDGKEFTSYSDCMTYEANAFKDVNLQKFDVHIPYIKDDRYAYVAYKINSENEFNMLMAYLTYNYQHTHGIIKYLGNGWYMVTTYKGNLLKVHLLNNVVKDFANMLAEIVENTLNF